MTDDMTDREHKFLPARLDGDSGQFTITTEMLITMKGSDVALLDRMVREWMAAHPDIEVWQEELPGGNFRITWNRRPLRSTE